MRYRARKFLENKALRHYLKSLVTYTLYRREKNSQKAEMRFNFEEKWAVKVFKGLRQITAKMAKLRRKGQKVENKSLRAVK
jgi:hypothetical protein